MPNEPAQHANGTPDEENQVTAELPVSPEPEIPDPEPVEAGIETIPVLDRTFSLAVVPGWLITGGLVLLAGLVYRLAQLDIYALTQREANWAYNAFVVYVGKAMSGAPSVPETSPLFLTLESLSFFLFGVTDATARIMPAIFGFGIVLLCLALRPFVSRQVVIGMMMMTALSPTLVFASRTVSPVIGIAFFTMLVLVTVLHAGLATSPGRINMWAAVAGFAVAAVLAMGPEGITSLIAVAMAIGIGGLSEPRAGHPGAMKQGVKSILGSPTAGLIGLTALIGCLILFFTRFFSDIDAINGLVTTFSEWGRLMGTRNSATESSFFFWALLLYEILAVVFAVVAVASRSIRNDSLAGELAAGPFVAWFVTSLILCSLASGRDPEQTAMVALPLVLLGGFGLGMMLERIPWSRFLTSTAGLTPLAVGGIAIGLVSTFVIIARANDDSRANDGAFGLLVQIGFVLVLLVAPLIYLLSFEFGDRERSRYAGWSALLVLAVLLGMLTIRSTSMLALSRADDGVELLAPRTPTTGVKAVVDQTLRLSRDIGVDNRSTTDNTGSYGISIAIGPEVRSPYAWYFRNFQKATITPPAGWNDASLVIAGSTEGMAEAGYVVQTRNAVNRVPPPYETLSAGNIFGTIFNPGKWYSGIRFLLYRDMESVAQPGQVSFGYSYTLSNQLNPNFGPFDLGDDVGPGSGLGQLNNPTDIALSADGQFIFVLDSGNLRVQKYERDGTYVSVWDGSTDANAAFATQFSLGPSGIFEGENGATYVADTWNHRIVILNENGEFAGEIGQRGVATDLQNTDDPTQSPGLFYGPRGVIVSDGEIFVTDTGNERVQVFATDGTFLRAFGGYGSGDGQLIEPVGITIGPDNNVYVADSGNGRINVYTRQGEFVSSIVIPEWQGQLDRVNYLVFGPDGVLYATAPSLGQVFAIGNGQAVVIAGPESGNGLERPMGITVDATGVLLVADAGTSSVVEFTPDVPESVIPAGAATPAASPAPVTPEESPPV